VQQSLIDPAALFGGMDIYLLDQLLRRRIAPGMTHARRRSCGGGRNLVHLLLDQGYAVHAFDPDPSAPSPRCAPSPRASPRACRPHKTSASRERVEANTFPDHAARRGDQQRRPPLRPRRSALRRHAARQPGALVSPGGLLFCRLASTIGMAASPALGGRRFRLPRRRTPATWSTKLSSTTSPPASAPTPSTRIKTTVVEDQRCMTTWVLRKPLAPPDGQGRAGGERIATDASFPVP
jgi:tellurite methyltransferase